MRTSAVAVIKGGQIDNKKTVKTFFESLPDGRYLIEADNSKKRTHPQNRYLHGVLIPEFRKALNSVGYNEVQTNEHAKLIMKSMFLTREIVNEETGEMIKYTQDTHNLSTVELGELIEGVIRFSAENMSYIIPYPSEQVLMFE